MIHLEEQCPVAFIMWFLLTSTPGPAGPYLLKSDTICAGYCTYDHNWPLVPLATSRSQSTRSVYTDKEFLDDTVVTQKCLFV